MISLALSAAMSAVSRARFRTPSSMAATGVAAVCAIDARSAVSSKPSHREATGVSIGVTAVRASRTDPLSDLSPASVEPTVVEAGRPPRFTTQVTLPRDDPAADLPFTDGHA